MLISRADLLHGNLPDDDAKRPPRMPWFGHNICGVLVQAKPENVQRISVDLSKLAGVEVHAVDESGRIVVTCEDTPAMPSTLSMTEIHNIPGVVAASLVYHHCDTEPNSEESQS